MGDLIINRKKERTKKMAYPVNKETFRRVVNQDLPTVEGDIVDEDDQNLPADFLERLQDTLGYSILGGYGSVKARLDGMQTLIDAGLKVQLITGFNFTTYHLTSGVNWYISLTPTITGTNEMIFIFFNAVVDFTGVPPSTIQNMFYIRTVQKGGSQGMTRKTAGLRSTFTFNWAEFNPPIGASEYKLRFLPDANNWSFYQIKFFLIRLYK